MMSKRLANLQSQTIKITAENNDLKKKILLLRNDINYIEMIARNELGMVNKGDVVYRWTK
jgi:cell division protein FtsB